MTTETATSVESTQIPLSVGDATRTRRSRYGDHEPKSRIPKETLEKWELTVGVEIHAQLNTTRKLFSAASTVDSPPNTNVALFDVAMPGSQPTFQKATLIPAIRAALALNCEVQRESRFDRKHYFHWDQPAGFQLTQYYQPFAKHGHITLHSHDGISPEDGESVKVGIKQVQMEQDTAKTISQPGDIHLLDFNRVGLPLIEIITMPQIRHPSTAAALVRKVQTLLQAVDACILGMEFGGLRADVNVSVRRKDTVGTERFAGFEGLGQRTEIKNLSSFKSVEDAIIAERDRQISALEAGETIVGETRGWSIGSSMTRRLRGKEGEVDYRYMPDPELGPVIIDPSLVNDLRESMGVMPDDELSDLKSRYGLTTKDAMSLMALESGGRAEYFRAVVDELISLRPEDDPIRLGTLCGNWVLHEMGGLISGSTKENPLRITRNGDCVIPAASMASLINLVEGKLITLRSAKKVLAIMFAKAKGGHPKPPNVIVSECGFWYAPLSQQDYDERAQKVSDDDILRQIVGGKEGKKHFLVGQIMRLDKDGRTDALEARAAVERLVDAFKTRVQPPD